MLGQIVSEPRPDPIAALAATGHLGLDYHDRSLWTPRVEILECPPPPNVKRRGRYGFFTADGTSGKGIPQSAAEWTAAGFNGIAAPDFIWLMQEASGNLAETVGGAVTLTAAGSPVYQQTVSGWSTKAVGTADGTTGQKFSSTNTNLPNLGTSSFMLLLYVAVTATPAATRTIFGFGTTTAEHRVTNSPVFASRSASNQTVGAVTVPTTVQAIVLQVNVTALSQDSFSTIDRITPTYSNTVTGKSLSVGAGQAVPPTARYLYMAGWKGTNGEVSAANIKSMLGGLGWTSIGSAWTVAHTVGISESESESESVAVIANLIQGDLAESESESESVAVSQGMPVGISESESESEAISVLVQSVVGLSDSEATSESLAVLVSFLASISESVGEDEQLAALVAFVSALSESESESEAIEVVVAFLADLSDDVDTDEATDILTAFVADLSDSESESESIGVVMAFIASVSASEALSDAVAVVAAQLASLSEAVTASEAVGAVIAFRPDVAESLGIAESVESVLTQFLIYAMATYLSGLIIQSSVSGLEIVDEGIN